MSLVDQLLLPDHAFSPVFTCDTLAIPLYTDRSHIACWVGYIASACIPGSEEAPGIEIGGIRFVRVSNLPFERLRACVAGTTTVEMIPDLGNLCRIRKSDVTRWVSTRDPRVLHDNAHVIGTLASALRVDRDHIGLTGSTLYRPADQRSDVDFVIYGEAASRVAARRMRSLLPQPGAAYRKHGVIQHWRFRLPESLTWFDPRFVAPESTTQVLLDGAFRDRGVASVSGLRIADDSNGIFYPSRYLLSDGTVLLSYRLGHNGYFRTGQVLGDTPLPVVDLGNRRYRLCLRHESISARNEP